MKSMIGKKLINTVFYLIAMSLCNTFLNAMDVENVRSQKKLSSQPTHRRSERELDTEIIWVQTADGAIIGVPQWQIDQMKVLQVLLIHQKGKNSEKNPVQAGMINARELTLLQSALIDASKNEKLEYFFKNLTPQEQTNLINSAFTVEAIGLASLLAAMIFPLETQKEMLSSSGILVPVVTHLKELHEHLRPVGSSQLPIFSVAFSPDSNYIASSVVSPFNNVTVWDVKTAEIKKIVSRFGIPVMGIVFSSDGKKIIAVLLSGGLKSWDIDTGEQELDLSVLNEGLGPISCAAFSPDGTQIITGTFSGNLILWNAQTGEKINVWQGNMAYITNVKFSPDGTYILSGGPNDLILWDAHTNKQIKIFQGHNTAISCLAFSHNGKYIISGSWASQDSLILWDVETGEKLQTFNALQNISIVCAAFSFDDQYIAIGTGDRRLILLDIKTGKTIKILHGNQSFVRSIAFSPDGKYMVSGGDEGELILWTLPDKNVLDYIKQRLNIAEARFIYRLYLATINNTSIIIHENDPDYAIYMSLPENVQKLLHTYFPFTITTQLIQTKKTELESQLFEKSLAKSMYEKLFGTSPVSIDEKIRIVLYAITQEADKTSIKYKALQKMLRELELEKEFEQWEGEEK